MLFSHRDRAIRERDSDNGGRKMAGEPGRGRARAAGIGEYVEVSKWQTFYKGQRFGVLFSGFSGKSSDYIRSDGGVREAFANQFHAASIVFRAIPAMHSAEDAIRTRL